MPDSVPTVLIIDDDPFFRAVARSLIAGRGLRTVELEDVSPDQIHRLEPAPDLILLDRRLRDHDALELIPLFRNAHPSAPLVLVTAETSVDAAVEAMRLGAFDFHPKPIDQARLLTTITRGIEHARLSRRIESLELTGPSVFEGLVGASLAMRAVFSIIENVAPTEASVMILGESGTGKELVARAVHRRSARREGRFVALNMAAIPDELIESTLFGHERGAFTGADRTREGAVEHAAGGTLFLDEVGEMPLEMQPKLLRFLQERSFRRVGGQSERGADVRIVSATNRDPLGAVREGRLRSDLYYRLNVVPIALAPLREREGDVALLAHRFLHDAARRHAKSFRHIAPAAMQRLEAAPWPGNVRQLQHVIERIVVLNDGPTVLPPMLPRELDPAAPAPGVRPVELPPALDFEGVAPLAELERRAILHALSVCGTPARAAVALGISEATIYRKMRQYRAAGKMPASPGPPGSMRA